MDDVYPTDSEIARDLQLLELEQHSFAEHEDEPLRIRGGDGIHTFQVVVSVGECKGFSIITDVHSDYFVVGSTTTDTIQVGDLIVRLNGLDVDVRLFPIDIFDSLANQIQSERSFTVRRPTVHDIENDIEMSIDDEAIEEHIAVFKGDLFDFVFAIIILGTISSICTPIYLKQQPI